MKVRSGRKSQGFYRRRKWWMVGVLVLSVDRPFSSCAATAERTKPTPAELNRNPLGQHADELVDTKEIQGSILPLSPPSRDTSEKKIVIQEPPQIVGTVEQKDPSTTSTRRRLPVSLERWLQNRSRRGSMTIDFCDDSRYPPREENLWTRKEKDAHPSDNQPTTNTSTTTSLSINNITEFTRSLRTRGLSPMVQRDPQVELTVSVSPISLVRLLHNLGLASVGALAAFAATLRLLAPMIVARRILSSIGYICYDYYNGRYIRTTYHKRLQTLQELEIPSVLRACGRMAAQLFAMVVVGWFTRVLLQAAPCFLPEVACRYWFGSVWVSSVLLTGPLMELWMKRVPALQLQPVAASATNSKLVLTQPWHILQWMKDPETWLLNLTRMQLHPSRVTRKRTNKPFRPDPLLFPSTWPPLMILSGTAMVHAIAQTLPIKTGANTRILMQDFCLAVTMLDEWKRLFLYEHRIALGLVWSAISFAGFFVLSVSAAMEVGWISCGLLLPIVFSCLVSGWMNAVLYSEHHVQLR